MPNDREQSDLLRQFLLPSLWVKWEESCNHTHAYKSIECEIKVHLRSPFTIAVMSSKLHKWRTGSSERINSCFMVVMKAYKPEAEPSTIRTLLVRSTNEWTGTATCQLKGIQFYALKIICILWIPWGKTNVPTSLADLEGKLLNCNLLE